MRLLPVKNIPPSLLSTKGIEHLIMPPELVTTYQSALHKFGLFENTLNKKRHTGEIGGTTTEEANNHLAGAFDGSCVRVQLALLDPKDETNESSDILLNAFSGDNLFLIDAPFGAGAGSFSLLANIAELRKTGKIPRQPLEIEIIGAEISDEAIGHAEEMLMNLRSDLESQAIFVTLKPIKWDASSPESTVELVKTIVKTQHKFHNSLVLIANFSGYLNTNLDKAKVQINELIKYSMVQNSFAVWIEPNTNKAKDHVLSRMAKILSKVPSIFQIKARENNSENDQICSSEFTYKQPIRQSELARVTIQMLMLKGNNKNESAT